MEGSEPDPGQPDAPWTRRSVLPGYVHGGFDMAVSGNGSAAGLLVADGFGKPEHRVVPPRLGLPSITAPAAGRCGPARAWRSSNSLDC